MAKKLKYDRITIANDSTDSDVVSILQSKDVEVLTCYPAKSWMKSTTCCVAVRLCVKAKDKGRVLDPKMWPAGVVMGMEICSTKQQ